MPLSRPWQRAAVSGVEVLDMGHGGNVIEELVTDHHEVEELFGKIEELPPGDKKRKLYADQATMELVRHSVAEEAYLYPAVREYLANGDAVADKEIDDHSRAEQIMKDLEGCEAHDPDFDRLIGTLMNEIRSHVADEEENLFPMLRGTAPRGRSTTWARRSGRRRRRHRPVRIRPHRTSPRPTNGWRREPDSSTDCAMR